MQLCKDLINLVCLESCFLCFASHYVLKTRCFAFECRSMNNVKEHNFEKLYEHSYFSRNLKRWSLVSKSVASFLRKRTGLRERDLYNFLACPNLTLNAWFYKLQWFVFIVPFYCASFFIVPFLLFLVLNCVAPAQEYISRICFS